MDDKVKRLNQVVGGMVEDKARAVFDGLKGFWVGDIQINLLVEKALKAHGEDDPAAFAARLDKMGKVGRAGLSVSVDSQIQDCTDPERLAKLKALKESMEAFHG
ncbi:MAG: hypothetical protein KF716_14910 [Anaerolineae bacterium]|nr:hypothetical protein [Anaerolineae bacterium]